MRFIKHASAIWLSILLCACSATPYQASGWSGGYSDLALPEPNTYQVKFSGNGRLKANQAYDYALLRSAELCIEKGFNFFSIIKQDTVINRVDVGTGELGAAKIYSYKPYVWMHIVLQPTGSENKVRTFNAHKVISRISEKYNIKMQLNSGSLPNLTR